MYLKILSDLKLSFWPTWQKMLAMPKRQHLLGLVAAY